MIQGRFLPVWIRLVEVVDVVGVVDSMGPVEDP